MTDYFAPVSTNASERADLMMQGVSHPDYDPCRTGPILSDVRSSYVVPVDVVENTYVEFARDRPRRRVFLRMPSAADMRAVRRTVVTVRVRNDAPDEKDVSYDVVVCYGDGFIDRDRTNTQIRVPAKSSATVVQLLSAQGQGTHAHVTFGRAGEDAPDHYHLANALGKPGHFAAHIAEHATAHRP